MPTTLAKEIGSFVRRNGPGRVFLHALETYLGALVRSWPGVEGLVARALFFRCFAKAAGHGLLIYPGVRVLFSRELSLGHRVAINSGSYLDARGGLTTSGTGS